MKSQGTTFRRVRIAAAISLTFTMIALQSAQAQQIPPVGHGFPNGKTVDTTGFFLGMPGPQALRLIEQQYAKQPDSLPAIEHVTLPSSQTKFFRFVTSFQEQGGKFFDLVTLFLGTPASGNQVLFIRRKTQYLPHQFPNRAATIAAFKERLGEPSSEERDQMVWYYQNGKAVKSRGDGGTTSCYRTFIEPAREHTKGDGMESALRHALNIAVQDKGVCDVVIRVAFRRAYATIDGRREVNWNTISGFDIIMFDMARFAEAIKFDSQATDDGRDKERKLLPKGVAPPRL
jgi:hypothetical protein